MDKELKNRSGTQSNEGKKNQGGGGRKRDELPGAPAKSNRQTKGRNEENISQRQSGTKKGPNNI